MSKKMCVTYQYAYVRGEITLCDKCADNENEPHGALGPVNHGRHLDACDGCWADSKRADYETAHYRCEG